MRVLQYNLQVKDTQGMVPEKIAKETVELGSNVVVMNVGGIYAWYRSRVPFHHINEYLPDDSRDLLRELIEAFHKENIRFVARFDFSIAEDKTYLNHPEWFSRTPDMQPIYRGEKRMGEWSLLLNTCALGGYRNEDVAVPVLKEVLENYDIDGIFLNAPHGITPIEMAESIESHANRAMSILKELPVGIGKDWEHTKNDIYCMSLLGKYFSFKEKAAVGVQLFRESGDKENQSNAVRNLQEASVIWKEYSDIVGDSYIPQVLTRLCGKVDVREFDALTKLDICLAEE